MKAIKIEKFGGPEVLELKDVEIGKPGPTEVLIKNLQREIKEDKKKKLQKLLV